MEANSLKHFYDALNAARAIQNFITDKTFEDYLADELLAAGVERKFEIIGDEARPARRWSMRSVGPKGVSSAGAHWAPNSQAFNRIRKEADRYPPPPPRAPDHPHASRTAIYVHQDRPYESNHKSHPALLESVSFTTP